MKTKIRVKYLTTALAFVRFATLIALLSYSCGHPALSVLARGETSVEMALMRLHTNPNGGSLMSSAPKLNQQTQPQVVETSRKMPLAFVENLGQVDSQVDYYLQGVDKSLYFTSEGITFALTGKVVRHADESPAFNASLRSGSLRREAHTEDATQQYALKLDFIGGRPGVRPHGENPTSAKISYFKGARDQWKTAIKTYSTLVYSDLWPGIDLIYTGTAEQMKYTFSVKPGADPNRIRLAYRGASEVILNNEGQLEVVTPVGGFHDDKPYSYQEVEGKRAEVDTTYALDTGVIPGYQAYGFSLGDYDKSKPLILDPAVRVYTGFIGGDGDEQGNGIAVDEDGNSYVVGTTTSVQSSFPNGEGIGSLPGLPRPRCNDADILGCHHTDAFVAKVNADGRGLIYASYIGGGNDEEGRAIAVDLSGRAYLTGVTNSDKSDGFPKTDDFPLDYKGGNDAFVVRLNKDGTGIEYAGYIGGAKSDEGNGIAVDNVGSAYITGSTDSVGISSGGEFPAARGPNPDLNGDEKDAFVAKVSQDGKGLRYCGYIGGINEDVGKGIAIDEQGRAYVTGFTNSDEGDGFPLLMGPDLEFNGGGGDAFVARVSSAKSGDVSLEYCGYIGGIDYDEGNAIAVSTSDSDTSVYVTGTTRSKESTFPNGSGFSKLPAGTLRGPDSTENGKADAFVVKLSESSAFIFAGYIGGGEDDVGTGIAVDTHGNAYITGLTESPGTLPSGFPDGRGINLVSGPDRVLTGGRDAFLVRVVLDVDASGEIRGIKFDLATYIGGVGEEQGNGIAVDKDGNAYVTGVTNSPRLESTRFSVLASPDRTFNGGISDAFVEKIGTPTSRPGPVFTPILSPCPDITVTALPGETSATVNYPLPNITTVGAALVASPPPGSVFPVGTTAVNIIEIDASGDAGVLCSFTITVNPAPPPPLALNCVGDLHVVVPPGHPAVVNYPLPVVNKPEGATLVCMPPPGSIFPLGSTSVACTATNTGAETASCSFIVDVH